MSKTKSIIDALCDTADGLEQAGRIYRDKSESEYYKALASWTRVKEGLTILITLLVALYLLADVIIEIGTWIWNGLVG